MLYEQDNYKKPQILSANLLNMTEHIKLIRGK